MVVRSVRQTIGSGGRFCEHSNSFWSMSEPAQQASLRKKLFDRRRSKICQSDVSAGQNGTPVTVHFVPSNTLRDAQKLHFMQFRACCPRDFRAFCAKTPRGTVAPEQ